MVSRLTVTFVCAVVLLAAHAAARSPQNPYRLKQPDQKRLCLDCHTDFKEKLGKRFVHTPVKSGDCSGCHDPHVSSHGKLLTEEPARMCARCHGDVVPSHAKSTHQVVTEGQCQQCHDPHASDHEANLVAEGNELCARCHQAVAGAVKEAKFSHAPVGQGCVTCHQPHGSDKAAHLLSTAVPAQCLGCHDPGTVAFAARHQKYPVQAAACTACHDPHGSSQPAMLLNTVHAPVGNGSCAQCHDGPDSPTPFATKRGGYELCKGCHTDAVNTMLGAPRLHWPVADRRGCANCHSPHASRQPKLVVADTPKLCGRCHPETLRRIEATAVKHPPAGDGTCLACHAPHGAQGAHLIDRPSTVALCTTCHDYETHSAHPIGDKAVDPRNPNARVDCQSCHRAHGTEFKWMLLAATNLELCTQCHKKFTR